MKTKSQINITNAIIKINSILAKLEISDHQVVILDFTHFTEFVDRENVFDVKFYIYGNEEYVKILNSEFIEKKGYAKFTSDYVKIVRNLNSNPHIQSGGSFFSFSIKEQIISKEFQPSEWHNTLKKYNFGGSSLILSKRHGEAQSAVYLITSKPFFKNEREEIDFLLNPNIIDDYQINNCISEIFIELEHLLLDEMIHNIYDTYKETSAFNYELIKRNDFLEIFQEEVDNYGHTIFNIFPSAISGINKIKKEIGLSSPYYHKLAVQEKSLLFTQMLFQIIGRREIEELKNVTICGMLELLLNFETSKTAHLNFKSVDSPLYKEIAHCDYIPKKIDSENSQANDSFIILWNFWHNAQKYSKIDDFFINVHEQDGHLSIEFHNQGYPIGHQNCLYLTGYADTPTSQRGGKGGLTIAKRKLDSLGWEVTKAHSIEINKGMWENRIILRIKNQSKT